MIEQHTYSSNIKPEQFKKYVKQAILKVLKKQETIYEPKVQIYNGKIFFEIKLSTRVKELILYLFFGAIAWIFLSLLVYWSGALIFTRNVEVTIQPTPFTILYLSGLVIMIIYLAYRFTQKYHLLTQFRIRGNKLIRDYEIDEELDEIEAAVEELQPVIEDMVIEELKKILKKHKKKLKESVKTKSLS